MIDTTEWMTAVNNDNSLCKTGFARVDTFRNRLNDMMKETNLAVCVAPFTISEMPWLMTCCAEHDAAQASKSLSNGTTRASTATRRRRRRSSRSSSYSTATASKLSTRRTRWSSTCRERNTVTMSEMNTDTKAYEQEHDVINEPVALVDHVKYLTTDTFSCKADLTFNNVTDKIDNIGAIEQKHDTDMTVAPVDHVKYMMMKTLSWKAELTFKDQTDDVSINETKESEQGNHVIYKSETEDVRADAAAAITITYRGTYAFYAYMSNAGNERDPVTKVFETKTWPDAFSKFPVFRLLGMVVWQITHYVEQKLARKNKKRAFRSPRQQHAAQALELNDAVLMERTATYPTEGRYNDLIDGRYEKTINVKTCEGKTITAQISLEQTTKDREKKDRSTDDQQLVARGGLQGQHTAERIRHVWRRNNRTDSKAIGRRKKTKGSVSNRSTLKEIKERKRI